MCFVEKRIGFIILLLLAFMITFLMFWGLWTFLSNKETYGQLNTLAPNETFEFGRLTGKWYCTMSSLNNDGVWQDSKAVWTWKYILNGHAIQDFWFRKANEPIDSISSDYYGTNIRIYDPQKKKWTCSWTENSNNPMSGFWSAEMRKDSSMIVYDDTKNWQIIFYNIKKESFDWKWDFMQKDSTMKTMVKIKATRKQ